MFYGPAPSHRELGLHSIGPEEEVKKVMAAYSCSILADRAIIFEEGKKIS
jgi:hypothetical protein